MRYEILLVINKGCVSACEWMYYSIILLVINKGCDSGYELLNHSANNQSVIQVACDWNNLSGTVTTDCDKILN